MVNITNYFTSIRMAIIKKTTTATKVSKDMEKREKAGREVGDKG